MTAPKRWYQLSMLQLLVAMAVVAVFVQLNLTVTRSEPIPIIGGKKQFQSAYMGWPLSYRYAQVYCETDDAKIDWFTPDYLSLAQNVAIGSGITLATTAILGRIQKRG